MTFDQLIADHPNLKRSAYFALKSWGYSADDAYHEALIVLWDAFRVGSPPENVCSWVITVLRRNEVSKWRKPENKIARAGGFSEGLEELAAPDAPFDEDLLDIIEEFPGADAELMVMLFVYRYKLREIAEIYKIPIGTVKSRVSRVRVKVRKRLEIRYG